MRWDEKVTSVSDFTRKNISIVENAVIAAGFSALSYVKPRVERASKVLGRDLEYDFVPAATGNRGRDVMRFWIAPPYYWAVYIEAGRGPVRPRTKKYLVWFRQPSLDPRLAGGYPKRREDIRRLTKAQFLAGLEANFILRQDGLEPYMLYTEGPIAKSLGARYFKTDMKEWERSVGRAIIERGVKEAVHHVFDGLDGLREWLEFELL